MVNLSQRRLHRQSLPHLPTRPGKKRHNHTPDRLVTLGPLSRPATLKIRHRFRPVVTTIRKSRHITFAPPAPRGCVKRAGSFWTYTELPRALCAENSARFMKRSKHGQTASRISVQVSALMNLCGPCATRFNTKLRCCAAP